MSEHSRSKASFHSTYVEIILPKISAATVFMRIDFDRFACLIPNAINNVKIIKMTTPLFVIQREFKPRALISSR